MHRGKKVGQALKATGLQQDGESTIYWSGLGRFPRGVNPDPGLVNCGMSHRRRKGMSAQLSTGTGDKCQFTQELETQMGEEDRAV